MNPLNASLKVPAWLALVVVALFLALSAVAYHYHAVYKVTDKALTTLEGGVKSANEAAAEELARLTAERDKKQAMLDKQADDQEKKDAEARIEIERLADELRNRPIRVRYVAATGGQGSCGPAGVAASGSGDSAGDAAATTGVLPESNTRRLGVALTEIETLSAAYNSCRSTLLAKLE